MTREDAVKGLRNVADWHYGKYEQTHEEDYLNDGDFLTAVANMLKEQEGLLKAHEPRVMTADDVVTLEKGDVIVLEQHEIGVIINAIYMQRITREDDDTTYTEAIKVVTAYTDGSAWLNCGTYGKDWRIWTSRPDEKRRAETPWRS